MSYLLTYRTTAHSTTGVPPCQLLMGRDLRTRLSLLQPNCERSVLEKQSLQKACHDRRSRPRNWVAGDRVLVRNHRDGPDWIPATIVDVLGPVTYIVETESGQRWKRHADQMKDWLSPPPSVTAPEPEVGESDGPSSAPDTDVVDPELGEQGDTRPAHSDDPETQESDADEDPETLDPSTEETGSPIPAPSPPRGVGSRYPTRVRHPPSRFDPSDSGTVSYLVI